MLTSIRITSWRYVFSSTRAIPQRYVSRIINLDSIIIAACEALRPTLCRALSGGRPRFDEDYSSVLSPSAREHAMADTKKRYDLTNDHPLSLLGSCMTTPMEAECVADHYKLASIDRGPTKTIGKATREVAGSNSERTWRKMARAMRSFRMGHRAVNSRMFRYT